MSNKKWRQPANPGYVSPALAQKQDDNKQQQEPVEPRPTGRGGEGAGQPHTDEGVRATSGATVAEEATAVMRQPVPRYDLNVDDHEAQGFVNEMTRFMGGIIRNTNIIMGKVSFKGLRGVVAADLPDADAPEEAVVEQNIELAQKHLPRSHPLLGLIRFALASSRLLHRILMTTHPQLFGRPSNAYKNIVHAMGACKKFAEGRIPGAAAQQAMADGPIPA